MSGAQEHCCAGEFGDRRLVLANQRGVTESGTPKSALRATGWPFISAGRKVHLASASSTGSLSSGLGLWMMRRFSTLPSPLISA